jgi:DNA-binding FadR family transcriptional regulator
MTRLNEPPRDELARRIVAGQLKPGASLPRETRLVEEFAISRGIVREVLRALEDARLIGVRHGRGARVEPETCWDHAHPVVIAARLATAARPAAIREAFQAQRALETAAARDAAAAAEGGGLPALAQAASAAERAATRIDAHEPSTAYHEADRAFHAALVETTGNRLLVHLSRRLQPILSSAVRHRVETPDDVELELAEHRRIVTALAARDGQRAADAVHGHLLRAEQHWERSVGG